MRIGIVNDMPMAVEALRRALHKSDKHQIAWTAENGEAAVALAARDTPDLILMDLIMPVMDGVEATRRIMQSTPCNILVVTASVSGNSGKVFEAMGAGALDVVATPVTGSGSRGGAFDLLKKIDRIARISGFSSAAKPAARDASGHPVSSAGNMMNLVAIGSSTGGPQALLQILSIFPAELPTAIVVIQHMDKQFTQGLADWLDNQVQLKVQVLEEGLHPQPGTILIPSTENHVIMKPDMSLGYSVEPRENYYHPSVDVFFKSLAAHWSGSCIGVILTGMGNDGAEGMLALKQKGHYSIAQDRESSVVFGMPKAAIETGAVCEILPLDLIGTRILELLQLEKETGRHA